MKEEITETITKWVGKLKIFRNSELRLLSSKDVEELEKEIKKTENKPQDNLKEYAYLCNECCCIGEIPIFKDGKCPECGSENKSILYIKKINEEVKKE